MKTLSWLGVLALLAGCGSTPTGSDGGPLKESDLGPAPANHSALFAGYLAGYLKDPYSAQVVHTAGPAKFVGTSGFSFNMRGYGWAACYAVNAKNSFGAYTGIKTFMAVYRNGQVVNVARTGETIYLDADIGSFCSRNPRVDAVAPGSAPANPSAAQSRITREALSALKPGVTTRADAERLFGAPSSISAIGQQTLLQWMTPDVRAHIAVLFDNSPEQRMVQISHSYFQ